MEWGYNVKLQEALIQQPHQDTVGRFLSKRPLSSFNSGQIIDRLPTPAMTPGFLLATGLVTAETMNPDEPDLRPVAIDRPAVWYSSSFPSRTAQLNPDPESNRDTPI